MTAPVQVLVVGFDEPKFSGEVVAELTRLREAGIVRLLDLLVVARAEDGTIETVEEVDGTDGADGGRPFGALAAALLGEASDGVATNGDAQAVTAWSLGDAVPPGSAAAVALIEHVWAGRLKDAIERAGGTALDEMWLAPAELEALAEITAKLGR